MGSLRRRDDADTGHTYYRSDRFYQLQGLWYFMTREQTQEGPFERRLDAENFLQRYIVVLNSGWLPQDNDLALIPLGEEE